MTDSDEALMRLVRAFQSQLERLGVTNAGRAAELALLGTLIQKYPGQSRALLKRRGRHERVKGAPAMPPVRMPGA